MALNDDMFHRITKPKTGTDFLASSHFNIGLEPKWLVNRDPLAYRSTFKKDYPPKPLTHTDRSKLPPPAEIMHRDPRIADHYCSVTRNHFEPKSYSKCGFGNSTYSLTKTNFKMDADKKIESFRTTHDDYFTPKSLQEAKNSSAVGDWSKSNIPQGDKEKVKWPASDYRGQFVTHDVVKRQPVHNDLFGGLSTIKGDRRIHDGEHFTTTMHSSFPDKYQARIEVDDSVKYPKTHIPRGDLEKCNYLLSTQQDAFKPHDITGANRPDRDEALYRLQSTSFKMGDNRLDSFKSTVQDSYRHPSGKGRSENANLNMGKSSFPEGDTDPIRSLERLGTTINRSHFKEPPSDYKNKIVDSSFLRFKSNVHLGSDDRLNSYETTMNRNFTSKRIPYQKALGDVYSSSIPTDFYKNLVTEPLYRTYYKPNTGVSKFEPNPVALDNLKRSHIDLADPSFREFSTTHRATYTPKEESRDRVMDTGKLQRSSVPIGTLKY